jgi:hypothetical protein
LAPLGTKLATFRVGDRVELLLHYSFDDEPPPQGTVVRITSRCLTVKMDRHGKAVRLDPGDVRIIGR